MTNIMLDWRTPDGTWTFSDYSDLLGAMHTQYMQIVDLKGVREKVNEMYSCIYTIWCMFAAMHEGQR